MTPEQTAKLARLQNRRTRYEIAATKGETKVLVGYSARKGRSGILSMLRQNVEKWICFAGTDRIHFRKRASEGADCSNWHVNFSGRTQRDAIIAGELPFFPTLLK